MRKTLTLVAAILTAGTLAACKTFWQQDEPPAPIATATETTPTEQTVTTDPVEKPLTAAESGGWE